MSDLKTDDEQGGATPPAPVGGAENLPLLPPKLM